MYFQARVRVSIEGNPQGLSKLERVRKTRNRLYLRDIIDSNEGESILPLSQIVFVEDGIQDSGIHLVYGNCSESLIRDSIAMWSDYSVDHHCLVRMHGRSPVQTVNIVFDGMGSHTVE